MTKSQLFPPSKEIPDELEKVIKCFEETEGISTEKFEKASDIKKQKKSNDVLKEVKDKLENKDFRVEETKKRIVKKVCDEDEKEFYVDAISKKEDIIIEVEAGQTTYANKCYLDIFKACMIKKVDYLVIAVPIKYLYKIKKRKAPKKIVKVKVYENVSKHLKTIYASRFWKNLPLKGILLIGY